VSPSESPSPRTPGGSQKKAVLGKVKSKAKKWMHLLHHKKKPAGNDELFMWTPRAGPSSAQEEDVVVGDQLLLDAYLGTPGSKQAHRPTYCTPQSQTDLAPIFFLRPQLISLAP
jgi:hypothetical protein